MSDNSNKLISQLSKKLNLDPNQVRSAAERGDYEKLLSQAEGCDSDRLRAVLNDPEKIKQTLASPQAQKLMKLLSDEK